MMLAVFLAGVVAAVAIGLPVAAALIKLALWAGDPETWQ